MDPMQVFPAGLLLLVIGGLSLGASLPISQPFGRTVRWLAFIVAVLGLVVAGFATIGSIIFRMNYTG